ncbi:hypothetical protein SeLEV6574_g08184 [Synchytrium endobioticum]|uniref:Serine incorporator n=1 Tax=Synchytrium endobioticum TaxID=286115 RepID=A0A507C7W9_9FUNG|nr:hypothetical protein SeLEV6574_g08184 [Synchytrium endobioticum]
MLVVPNHGPNAEAYEKTDNKLYVVVLVAVTACAFLGSLVAVILMYLWFGSPDCKLNQFFISLGWILCVLATPLSVAPAVQDALPKSGLGQAAMVTVYSTYLVASTLISVPTPPDDYTCNFTNKPGTSTATITALGVAFTFTALAYSASGAAIRGTMGAAEETALIPENEDENGDMYPADDEENGVQYSYSYFHIVFAMAAMYLAMLLTNWNTFEFLPDDNATIGKSMGAVWVKIVSSWVVLLLYAWSLIAPLVLDREFK